MKRYCGLCVAVLLVAVCVAGADWPQYLGPDRNGVSSETGLARTWHESGPKVLWTAALGEGYGGPAVSEGKVYVLDRMGNDRDVFRCIDLVSGEEDWSYDYEAPGRLSHPGSRSVAAIDGDHVYTCGPFGDFYCFNRRTKKPVWKKNIWTDFGGERLPTWGISQNPLVYGDTVIVAAQTEQAGIVAYDKVTGRIKWKTPAMKGNAGYVSPTLVKIAGGDHLVMITAGPRGGGGRPGGSSSRGRGGERPEGRAPGGDQQGTRRPGGQRPEGRAPGGDQQGTRRPGGQRPEGRSPGGDQRDMRGHGGPGGESGGSSEKGAVLGMDPKTGKILWSYEGWQCQTPVPNVTAIGDGRIFITGGYMAGSAMIKVARTGKTFAVSELYKTPEFGTHVHPAIYYKGHLYGHCSTGSRGVTYGMVCMDVDGNVKWKTEKDPLFDKGGFILADDMIISVDGTDGLLYLIKPSPEGFKKLASKKLLDTSEAWAPLALVDGKLLIRDQEKMLCVDVR
ncbi:MAG: PQQ-binding-like beta-propeller repeat protein [Planctomycetes bacterium]|nr:PQQ-binding-like beta-propeller repeat protein [Planctomycetota bacterium]